MPGNGSLGAASSSFWQRSMQLVDMEINVCLMKNENLKAAYQQLCDSYRAIDDFRMKLLGFLPLATGGGIFLLLGPLSDEKTSRLAQSFTLPVGIFGFVITFGLFCYEIYGIKKCGRLIEAGNRVELGCASVGNF